MRVRVANKRVFPKELVRKRPKTASVRPAQSGRSLRRVAAELIRSQVSPIFRWDSAGLVNPIAKITARPAQTALIRSGIVLADSDAIGDEKTGTPRQFDARSGTFCSRSSLFSQAHVAPGSATGRRKTSMASRQSKPQKETVERVDARVQDMASFAQGPAVRKSRSPRQAVAIALSEAGASDQQTPKENEEHLRRTKTKERRGETARDEIEGRPFTPAVLEVVIQKDAREGVCNTARATCIVLRGPLRGALGHEGGGPLSAGRRSIRRIIGTRC